jgi:branched-chain amino acid transport system substrate-binding protein
MKSLKLALAAVVLAAALPAGAQQQGVTADTVVVGAFGPITGPAAYIGLAGRDGMNLAIKEINAAGGVNGRKLAAVFEDDAHSPTRGLAAAKKLIEQDKAFMLLSVGGSNATAGTIDYVRDSKTVMYVSIASAPQVTWPFARNMFRGSTTESARYGELYAEFLTTNYKTQKIAIMSGREEYPRNEGDATVAKLKAWFNVTPVARVEFNIGDKDFTPQLVEVQRAAPDVIAFLGNPAEAAIAMRQAKELGMKQAFFVGSNMVDPALITVGRAATEGVTGFSLIPYLPGSKNPDMAKWEAAWKKEYPSAPVGRPNNFDVMGYADTYVIADAMKRAGRDLTTDSFIRALEATNGYRVGAIATPRTFTTKHHIGNLSLVPLIVQNGAWEPVNWQSTRESDILKRYQ